MRGILFVGLSGPRAPGEIEPNHTVGRRTADTLADPPVWYAANAASGRDLFRLGARLVAAAVLLPWVLERAAVAALVVLVVGGLLGVVGSVRAETRHLLQQRGALLLAAP